MGSQLVAFFRLLFLLIIYGEFFCEAFILCPRKKLMMLKLCVVSDRTFLDEIFVKLAPTEAKSVESCVNDVLLASSSIDGQ